MGFKITDDEKIEIAKDFNKILTWIISHWWVFLIIACWYAGVIDFIFGLMANRMLGI